MSDGARDWDWPVRICHWSIVLLVLLQFGTGEFGWLDLDWHFYFGYALLGLLAFRLLWGFVGSPSARFRHSLVGPARVLAYVRRFRTEKSAQFIGHNPLGAYAALILWLLLLAQALTGLLTSDDVLYDGPLVARWPDWVDFASRWHHLLKNVLLAMIGLHVLAIAAYWFIKRENLLAAMIHGRRD